MLLAYTMVLPLFVLFVLSFSRFILPFSSFQHSGVLGVAWYSLYRGSMPLQIHLYFNITYLFSSTGALLYLLPHYSIYFRSILPISTGQGRFLPTVLFFLLLLFIRPGTILAYFCSFLIIFAQLVFSQKGWLIRIYHIACQCIVYVLLLRFLFNLKNILMRKKR